MPRVDCAQTSVDVSYLVFRSYSCNYSEVQSLKIFFKLGNVFFLSLGGGEDLKDDFLAFV